MSEQFFKNSSDVILIDSLRILSGEIQSDDGVANACVAEAAERLGRLTRALRVIQTWASCDKTSLQTRSEAMEQIRAKCDEVFKR